MKKIKEALEEPEADFLTLITKSDLKKNVEYFLKVLENVLQDERKQVSLYIISFKKICIKNIIIYIYILIIINDNQHHYYILF